MSTILDALKRSEQERKLNDVPTLLDMPAPQERARWPLVLACVIALVLLSVIAWILLFNNAQPPTAEDVVISNEAVINDSGPEIEADADSGAGSGLITVSVVSYADEPSARFVMINGKLFYEGEFVMAGVKVESIQQGSVVLIERGERITRQL